MPSSAVAAGRLALAVLAIGAAAGCAQEPRETNELALQGAASGAVPSSAVVVHPARVPVAGSPPADERVANLRPPPPGPIESRLLSLPGGEVRLPSDRRRNQMEAASASSGTPASAPPTAAVFTTPPVSPLASGEARPATAGVSDPALATGKPVGEPAPSSDGTPIALITFAGRSANLSDDTKSRLDQIARSITDKKLRRIELRAFATGNDLDSRKIALARALIVRAYLIDSGVKSRIEVGSFAGDGEHVEILVPKT